MKRILGRMGRLQGVMLGLACMAGTAAAEDGNRVFGFGELGYADVKSSGISVQDDSGADISGSIDKTLWFGRFGAQKALHQGVFEAGWEAGAGLGWTSPDVDYLIRSDGGVTTRVSVQADLFILQTYGGLYAALNAGDRLRFSISGGPAFVFGSQESDPVTRQVTIGGNTVDVEVGGKDTDFKLAGYLHAALHLRVAKDVWVGAGVGRMTGELNFSDTIGKIPLDDVIYSLSLAAPVDL